MDELLIRFNGFQPSEFTRAYLDEKISAIYDEAPYGASLRADFSRLNREFKGLVTIQSPVGRFFRGRSRNPTSRGDTPFDGPDSPTPRSLEVTTFRPPRDDGATLTRTRATPN